MQTARHPSDDCQSLLLAADRSRIRFGIFLMLGFLGVGAILTQVGSPALGWVAILASVPFILFGLLRLWCGSFSVRIDPDGLEIQHVRRREKLPWDAVSDFRAARLGRFAVVR